MEESRWIACEKLKYTFKSDGGREEKVQKVQGRERKKDNLNPNSLTARDTAFSSAFYHTQVSIS